MLINAFSYWAIAFGLGYYLAHEAGWGAYGLWTGLITGLTLASLLLGVRLHRVYGLYIANSVQQAPLKDAPTGVT
jgi:MATE family multidrug resistance protein